MDISPRKYPIGYFGGALENPTTYLYLVQTKVLLIEKPKYFKFLHTFSDATHQQWCNLVSVSVSGHSTSYTLTRATQALAVQVAIVIHGLVRLIHRLLGTFSAASVAFLIALWFWSPLVPRHFSACRDWPAKPLHLYLPWPCFGIQGNSKSNNHLPSRTCIWQIYSNCVMLSCQYVMFPKLCWLYTINN